MNIARDSDIVELDGPPTYDYGARVRSRRTIRNDGTFLQQFYIYGVDFPARGYRVGMKRKEIETVSASESVAAPVTEEEAV